MKKNIVLLFSLIFMNFMNANTLISSQTISDELNKKIAEEFKKEHRLIYGDGRVRGLIYTFIPRLISTEARMLIENLQQLISFMEQETVTFIRNGKSIDTTEEMRNLFDNILIDISNIKEKFHFLKDIKNDVTTLKKLRELIEETNNLMTFLHNNPKNPKPINRSYGSYQVGNTNAIEELKTKIKTLLGKLKKLTDLEYDQACAHASNKTLARYDDETLALMEQYSPSILKRLETIEAINLEADDQKKEQKFNDYLYTHYGKFEETLTRLTKEIEETKQQQPFSKSSLLPAISARKYLQDQRDQKKLATEKTNLEKRILRQEQRALEEKNRNSYKKLPSLLGAYNYKIMKNPISYISSTPQPTTLEYAFSNPPDLD